MRSDHDPYADLFAEGGAWRASPPPATGAGSAPTDAPADISALGDLGDFADDTRLRVLTVSLEWIAPPSTDPLARPPGYDIVVDSLIDATGGTGSVAHTSLHPWAAFHRTAGFLRPAVIIATVDSEHLANLRWTPRSTELRLQGQGSRTLRARWYEIVDAERLATGGSASSVLVVSGCSRKGPFGTVTLHDQRAAGERIAAELGRGARNR